MDDKLFAIVAAAAPTPTGGTVEVLDKAYLVIFVIDMVLALLFFLLCL